MSNQVPQQQIAFPAPRSHPSRRGSDPRGGLVHDQYGVCEAWAAHRMAQERRWYRASLTVLAAETGPGCPRGQVFTTAERNDRMAKGGTTGTGLAMRLKRGLLDKGVECEDQRVRARKGDQRMSTKAVYWALNRAPVSNPMLKLVLVAMAEVAHPDGTESRQSMATVAEKIQVSERTVQRYTRILEDRGSSCEVINLPQNTFVKIADQWFVGSSQMRV